MNEQAQKILVDLLQKASNGIDSAVSFSQAQIHDVVQQLIQYKIYSYSIRIAIFSMMLVFCVALFVWIKKRREDNSVAITILVIAFLFASFALLVNIQNLIQVIIAPKVWLIEYAASLVK